MNMCVLKKTNKIPRPGDVFVLQVAADKFVWGRVIKDDTRIGNFEGVWLLYLYSETSTSLGCMPELKKENLLIPPFGSNRQPWQKGYFQTVKHVSLNAGDILASHCFIDGRGWYFDEYGNRLESLTDDRQEWGDWGVFPYVDVDERVSEALGL